MLGVGCRLYMPLVRSYRSTAHSRSKSESKEVTAMGQSPSREASSRLVNQ